MSVGGKRDGVFWGCGGSILRGDDFFGESVGSF